MKAKQPEFHITPRKAGGGTGAAGGISCSRLSNLTLNLCESSTLGLPAVVGSEQRE
jgi:hypothetical protein